jgi:branched-chain amino acid transport system permease protein
VLRLWTEYWHLPLGVLLLCVVFGAPRGLVGLFGPLFSGRAAATQSGKAGS